jgi:uncharacterized YigZ family protein
MYLVPSGFQRTETTVANSRFITSIGRVETVEAAKAFLAQIRAEMPEASHHVYAFRVGYGNSVIEGVSDDGEPTGTSGPPVLAVLRGTKIGDVMIVVTRYFGGTKLGTGGLVRAYSEAAHVAFGALQTEEKIEKLLLGIETPYSFYERIKRLIAENHGAVYEESFEGEITILAEFPKPSVAPFSDALQALSAGQIQPVILS